MAKKVLSEIKNKQQKIHKIKFLILFFAFGFLMMSLPLINWAATSISSGTWRFNFGDNLGLTDAEGIAIDASSASIKTGFLSGFLKTDIISPSDLLGWQKIFLNVNLGDATVKIFKEDFINTEYRDSITTADWNGSDKVTLPTAWKVTAEGKFAEKPSVSGDNIAWVEDNKKVYRCNLEVGNCLTESTKTFVFEGTSVGQVDVSSDYLVWSDNGSLYKCNLKLASGAGSCNLGSVDGPLSGTGSAKLPRISDNYIVYLSSSLVKRYNLNTNAVETICSSASDCGGLPDISGDRVVWNSSASKVYLYSEATGSIIISGAGTINSAPKISKNYVVWVDVTDSNNKKVYLYNTDSGIRKLIAEKVSGPEVDISNDLVTFVVDNNVYGYQISTGEKFLVYSDGLTKNYLSISNNKIVFASTDVGVSQIGLAQINRQNRLADTGTYSNQTYPNIDQTLVVWQNDEGGNSDIYLTNIDDGWQKRITAEAATQTNPDIWQNYIVWQDKRNGNPDVYLCDWRLNGSAGGCLIDDNKTQVTTDTAKQVLPQVYGNYIVWQDWREGDPCLYGYNIETETEFRITEGSLGQYNPRIYGNYIVWEDRVSDENFDIYMCDLSKNGTAGGCNLTDTKTQITSDIAKEYAPDVSEKYLIWHSDDGIYLYSLESHESQKISSFGSYARIYGDYVVFVGGKLYYIPLKTTLPDTYTQYFPVVSDEQFVWESLTPTQGIYSKAFIKYPSKVIAQSKNILPTDSSPIATVKLEKNQSDYLASLIKYFVSNNGSDWETISLGDEHTFLTVGSQLRWKAEISSGGLTVSPEIYDLKLTYGSKSAKAYLKVLDEAGAEIPGQYYALDNGSNEIDISEIDKDRYNKLSMRLDLSEASSGIMPSLNLWKLIWKIPAGCGNGIVDLGEECDDGNTNNNDGCTNGCLRKYVLPVCGNGTVEVGENCDDGNLINGDGCSATCKIEYLKVFITSFEIANSSMNSVYDPIDGMTKGNIWYNGEGLDLHGIQAADMICQKNAEKAGLSGKYQAWLSTDEYNPADNWTHYTGQYRLLNGGVVANNWEDLIADDIAGNFLIKPINFSASGEVFDGRKAFTGTGSDGRPAFVVSGEISDFCYNWQSTDSEADVSFGSSSALTKEWTNFEAGTPCNNWLNLYCFQQIENILPICGNGILEAGEGCEDGNLVGGDGCSSTCTSEIGGGSTVIGDAGSEEPGDSGVIIGGTESGGTETGGSGVSDSGGIGTGGSSSSGGSGGVGGNLICGNNLIDAQETCDGTNLNNKECSDFENFDSGVLGCNSNCQYDFSNCYQGVIINPEITEMLVTIQTEAVEPMVSFYKEKIIGNKVVQEANKTYIAPAITAVAAVNFINTVPLATTAIPFVQYLLQFLSSLFTEPTYLFATRKRKWGVIYDSLTKEPISLAVVRLYNAKTHHLVATRVTDHSGRYYFIADPKIKYRIEVKSADYDFPSKKSVAADAENGLYKKLYLGGEINLSANEDKKQKDKMLINFDVPVDLKKGLVSVLGYTKKVKTKLDNWENYKQASVREKNEELKKLKQQIRERRLSNYIAFMGFAVTVISLLISPSPYLLGLLSLHSILLATFIFLAHKPGAKSWGKVFDKKNGQGISQALVRLFDEKFGKLLMTQVTISDGNYGFLVDSKKKYLLTSEKEEYRMIDEHLEVESSDEGLIKKEIALEKRAKRK